jgi:hypothetical protein
VRAAIALHTVAYLPRFLGARRIRCSDKLSSTPKSSTTCEGGCSLAVCKPKLWNTRFTASKWASARRIWRPFTIHGAP